MQELLEAIQVATAEDATADQKSAGAQACRTILTALEAQAGKPLALPGAPPPNPLAGIDLTQALDFLIERLRQSVPADNAGPGRAQRSAPSGLRIALVRPPVGPTRGR
jgi:hypothetical protein